MAILTLNFTSSVLTQQQVDAVADYILGEYCPDGFPDDFNPFLSHIKGWYIFGSDSGPGFFEYFVSIGSSTPSLKERNDTKFKLRLALLSQ